MKMIQKKSKNDIDKCDFIQYNGQRCTREISCEHMAR